MPGVEKLETSILRSLALFVCEIDPDKIFLAEELIESLWRSWRSKKHPIPKLTVQRQGEAVVRKNMQEHFAMLAERARPLCCIALQQVLCRLRSVVSDQSLETVNLGR